MQFAATLSAEALRTMKDDDPLAPLVDAVQENFTAYIRLFAALPDTIYHEDDDNIWFVNPAGAPGNHVLRSIFSVGNADDRIEEIITQVAPYTDRIDWPLYRNSRPLDLDRRLADRGLSKGTELWMLADLDAAVDQPFGSNQLQVVPVTSDHDMVEWWHASAAGFEMELEAAKPYYEAYARRSLGERSASRHYIGYCDGRPVTSATLLLAGGIAGIYDVSTPPHYRGRGFGTAITYSALHIARQEEFRYACLMSSPMGRRLYQRLGFSVHLHIPEFRWRATATRG